MSSRAVKGGFHARGFSNGKESFGTIRSIIRVYSNLTRKNIIEPIGASNCTVVSKGCTTASFDGQRSTPNALARAESLVGLGGFPISVPMSTRALTVACPTRSPRNNLLRVAQHSHSNHWRVTVTSRSVDVGVGGGGNRCSCSIVVRFIVP